MAIFPRWATTSLRHIAGIGRVGEITLQKARQDAEQLIGEMAGGTDPVAHKRDQTAGGLTLLCVPETKSERIDDEFMAPDR